MMYWDADNSLEFCTEFAMGVWERSLTSNEDVNIIALVDLKSDDGIWIYEIADGLSNKVATWDEMDTGDPASLEKFVLYSMETYPSEKTMLVVQDHGFGWRGICKDETVPGYTLMPIDGLAGALKDVKAETGKAVDVLCMDACNMATIEVAYELRDAATYFVATETTMPFDGLPYEMFITSLVAHPEMSPREIAAEIVFDTVEYYSSQWDYSHIYTYNQDFVTICAVDLARMGAVVDAFGSVADMLVDMMPEYRKEISEARGPALLGKWTTMAGYEWMPDVYTFLCGLKEIGDPDLNAAIDAYDLAIHDALVAEAHSKKYKDSLHGLNIWFPPSFAQYNSMGWVWARQFIYDDIGLDFVSETSWNGCLMAYYGR
jgi:hypothetical protein